MHVTILQLIPIIPAKDWHYTDDEVFGSNESKFPCGVEEHTGAKVAEDVDEFCKWLGPALRARGVGTLKGRAIHWVEIDRSQLEHLFERPFRAAKVALAALDQMTLREFVSGIGKVPDAIYRLKEAYDFDDFYIMDRFGSCERVSGWMRVAAYADDVPAVQRFYVNATYDGGQ